MDIADLGRYSTAELVDGLWDAKEAERTAQAVKDAMHAELVKRLPPDFDGGQLEGRSRTVRAMRYFTPDVSNPDALRTICRTLNIEAKVFTINKNALSSAMREPSVAKHLAAHVTMAPYWQFRVQRAT